MRTFRPVLAGTMAVALLGALSGPIAMATSVTGMVIQEVEPGVFRVVNDGIRDLGSWRGTWGQDGGVTVAADGTAWILEANGDYYPVGDEPTRGLPQAFRPVWSSPRETFGADALHAGRTGQLWAWDAQAGRVNVLVEGEWQERSDLAADAMAVDGRGDAWAASRQGLHRIDADGETLIEWPIDRSRDVAAYTLDVSAEGTVYVLAGPQEIGTEGGFLDSLLRYDGSGWTELALPVPISVYFPGDGMSVGADGTVWVAGDDYGGSDYRHHRLARLDGTEWTIFTAADGVLPWGGKEGFAPGETLDVSTDGSVWVDATSLREGRWAECDGVARFDGSSATQYLRGRCLVDIDFAPDGSAWVLADGDDAPVEVFVITSGRG